MSKPILVENEEKRLSLSLPLLICFALYTTWQMGIIYFSGTALSVDGRTPLPVSIANMTLLIAVGYILSIAFITLFPKLTVKAERITAGAALLSALTLYLPLSSQTLANLYYFQSFCCIFMIGLETSIIVNFFTQETSIKHLLVAYAIANILVAFLQNDFAKVSFSFFRLFMVISLALLSVFFWKLPVKIWPRYVKESDDIVRPKKLFTGLYVLSGLGCFMTLFGTAVAENITHGVFVAFTFSAIYGFIIFLLWKGKRITPLRSAPVLVGIAALGFVLAIVSLYVPSLSLVACALLGAGITTCWLNPFYGVILAKLYPSRYIAPIIIGMAFGTVFVQTMLLETFRDNIQMLYLIYLAIAVIMAIFYLVLEPYLVHSFDKGSEENSQIKSELLIDVQGDNITTTVPAKGNIENLMAHAFDKLSKQEIRVAELIIQGYTNSEMAKVLNITENTVKSYRKTLYSKLQIHSKRELFELAEKNGD